MHWTLSKKSLVYASSVQGVRPKTVHEAIHPRISLQHLLGTAYGGFQFGSSLRAATRPYWVNTNIAYLIRRLVSLTLIPE
jgi:hypothetical protein